MRKASYASAAAVLTAGAAIGFGHAQAAPAVPDLSGATVLPGLIDSHTHITEGTAVTLGPVDHAVRGTFHAKRTLEAGFTADIIAAAGDPLADISELRRATFVMKGGSVR